MQFDFEAISAGTRYKLLTGTVVPRPIAWVTTLHENGSVNLAPFSFFNAIGTDPGLVAIGIGNHADRPKDTAANILRTDEFVVNLVPRELAQAMSDSAAVYEAGVSEVDDLGLALEHSHHVQTPRLADSPVALECRLHQVVEVGNNRLILGLIVAMHVTDQYVQDAEAGIVDTQSLDLVGRMGGLGGYTYTDHPFTIQRK